MPRPLIHVKQPETTTKYRIDAAPIVKPKLAGLELIRRLKRNRTKTYIGALAGLDAGTHLHDPAAVDALAASVESEFEDLAIEQRPLGYVQKCILGPEYEVHILDLTGSSILSHFKFGQPMPDPFEGARRLALHPGKALLNTYAFVEVFSDGRLVAVYADGPVTSVDPTSI